MPSVDNIKYIRASSEYHDAVIDFIYNDYLHREVLRQALDCEPRSREDDPKAIAYYLKQLKEGLSFIAIDTNNEEVVGICLNVLWRTELDVEDYNASFESCYFPLLKFLESLEAGHDLFSKYGVDKVFQVLFLGVLDNYGGRGIAKELLKRSEQLAREQGFKIMESTATGPATRSIFTKFNYGILKEEKMFGFPGLTKAKPEDMAQFLVKEI